MQRTRPTPSMSPIHSVAAPVRSASWLRSGISVSSSDSTSRDDVHRLAIEHLQLAVDAHRRPRSGREIQRRRAARRRHAQQPLEPGQRRIRDGGGGCSERIGFREIGSTARGCGAGTVRRT